MSDATKPAPTPLIEKLRRMEEMARQAEYGFSRLFGLTDAATLREAIAALLPKQPATEKDSANGL